MPDDGGMGPVTMVWLSGKRLLAPGLEDSGEAMRAVALHFKTSGVRVNANCPSIIWTSLIRLGLFPSKSGYQIASSTDAARASFCSCL